jgi:K+-sensing histidine kinase KdpD
MSFTLSIQDEVTPALKALKPVLAAGEINRVMGQAVSNLVRAHLVERDRTHANALGGKRTHFYGRAAKATFYTATATQASVTVAAIGIRQRLQGGQILPRNAKLLTIPAIAEAYGKRAREFNNLRFAIVPNEKGKMQKALVEAESTSIKKTKETASGAGYWETYYLAGKKSRRWVSAKWKVTGRTGGRVFFWLAKQANQKPDPTVLPTDQAMAAAAVAAASAAVDRALKAPPSNPTTS